MADLQVDSNAPEVAQALHRAATELSDLESANEEAAAIIAAAPQPVRTGQLAASIRADVTAHGLAVAGWVRHWSFVEWGAPRRHVKAQHPLRSQLETRRDAIIAVYTEHATHAVALAGD